MIKHIVFFRHKDFDIIGEELVFKLTSLKKNIEYIIELEVGVDFLRSERSFDCAMTVTLATQEDLTRYANDPIHAPVIAWIKSNGFETKVVDYHMK